MTAAVSNFRRLFRRRSADLPGADLPGADLPGAHRPGAHRPGGRPKPAFDLRIARAGRG